LVKMMLMFVVALVFEVAVTVMLAGPLGLPGRPDTVTGVLRSVVVPSPSWP
jgi:hypothetical protein